jgi:hypothetical protein
MPAGAGFTNYSKWDKLELSDDEDTHPGAKFIEANTLRRIKRESHEVREQERQEKLQKLQAEQAAGACACRDPLGGLLTRRAQTTRLFARWRLRSRS